MAYKEYTKEQLIKKFGKGNKQIQVYKKYDYCNHKYIYEVRGVKNKPHENHQTVWEVLTDGVCWTKDEYDDYALIQKYNNAFDRGWFKNV